MRRFLNRLLIEDYPEIVEEMQRLYRIYGRPESVFGRGRLALALFLRYGLFGRDPVSVRDKKREKLTFPESSVSQPVDLSAWKARIEKADTVIFDAWTSLLLPLIDRKQAGALSDVLDGHLGLGTFIEEVPVDEEALRDAAKIFCDLVIDQPFVRQLFDEAVRSGKKVLIRNSSDWIRDDETEAVLRRYGYPDVSGQEDRQENALLISTAVRDNLVCVRCLGDPYRAWRNESIITALYDGIVDLHLHGGENKEDLFYEYGFVCGGILTVGYCQFLNRLAGQEGIDRFLFLARDGDIVEKVYQRYFEERDHRYLLFSRFASLELIFTEDPMEYIQENIRPRIYREKTDNSLRRILKECGLEVLTEHLGEASLSESDVLTERNLPQLTELILRHREEIGEVFAESREAAKEYFLSQVGDASHVCAVDVGWRGTSTVYLKKLLRTLCHWEGRTTGTLIGAQGLNPRYDVTVKARLQRGDIHSFVFESSDYRRCGRTNEKRMTYQEIVSVEALFSSEADTLLRYSRQADGSVGFLYGEKNENAERIRRIHQGILDFCDRFVPLIKRYGLIVTPRDAYAPLDAAMRNRRYRKQIFQACREVPKAINGF